MSILVVNCGSSSIKYQLFDLRRDIVLTSGLMERIGEAESRLIHRWQRPEGGTGELRRSAHAPNHRSAFEGIAAIMEESGVLGGSARVTGIGHRVVHGGEAFQQPTLIDADVVAMIRRLIALAPVHNPANLTGIEVCLELFPGVPQVAVFDTAFHQTLPPHAYRYPLPEDVYREHGVRRYGFHGTSHAFVAKQAALYLGKPLASLRLITLHLGNGASATAIAAGRSVDTSMGLTPLEGLMMGTRCGDIDPSIPLFLHRATGLGTDQLESMLNQESGIKGICGANDMREVQRLAAAGDERARLAIDMYCYRIRKYIGAYLAVLGHADAIVFTAGVGENAASIREQVCHGLTELGITIDRDRNRSSQSPPFAIQAKDAAVKILVIATDEEREIAQTVADLAFPAPLQNT